MTSSVSSARPSCSARASAVHLLEYEPPAVPWDTVWVYWPDFGLPDDHRHLRSVLTEAWRRAEAERVEVACWGDEAEPAQR